MINYLAKGISVILAEEGVHKSMIPEICDKIIDFLGDLTSQQAADLREELITR